MRQPLVAGNWKMNGSLESVGELLDGIKAGIGDVKVAEVAVCPPSIYIPAATAALRGSVVSVGGQDVSVHASGAYTGETAGPMLKDLGCKYVIIGHSERRSYHGETDELVAEKFEAALSVGLVPIFCVGETLEEREGGITEAVVGRQVDAVLNRGGADMLGKGVIAYEPVWAIGTGKTATPEQAQDVHAFIRARVAAKDPGVAEGVRILYGGSMKPDNARELLAKPDIDGGLIGGASLKAGDFLGICTAAND
jgi:triosephosphate isomerase